MKNLPKHIFIDCNLTLRDVLINLIWLESIGELLDGREVSEFMESFGIVKRVQAVMEGIKTASFRP